MIQIGWGVIISKKYLFLISILILFVLSIGFASAADVGFDDASSGISDGNTLNEISSDQSSSIGITEDSLEIQSESQLNDIEEDEEDNGENDGEDNENTNQEIVVSGNTFEDIQNALLSSKDNDTIKLSGTYVGSGNFIYTNKNLIFEGENAVLDAKGLSGILVSEKAITLKNIAFKNAAEKAAVKIEGNATFINCTFEGNKYMAVDCKNNEKSDSVNIRDCIFKSNNIALRSVGLILNMENTVFNSNKVTSWDETVISILDTKSYASKTSIKNCSFVSNTGSYQTFYYYLINNASTNIIDNCTFNKNKAGDYAVIYLEKGVLTIKNSLFGNNTKAISTNVPNQYTISSKLTIQDSIFEGNKLVLDNNANCSIVSCTFRNNSVLISSDGPMTIKNSRFLNNNDAINLWTFDAVNVINSTFTNSHNNVTAIYSPNAILRIKDCTFKSNKEAAIISCNKMSITKGNKTTKYSKILSFNNDLKAFNFMKYSPVKFVTTYQSGKAFKVKAVLGSNGKLCKNMKFELTVYSGNNYVYNTFLTTNSKGIASFKLSNLKAGNYKAIINSYVYRPYSDAEFTKCSLSVQIKKASTVVSAPYVTAKAKKSNYFKVTVKNKASKKLVPNLKLKLKVYTGKKYRIYTVKTNKKGIASFNTRNLKKGIHAVVISSGNTNFIVSRKSRITIK